MTHDEWDKYIQNIAKTVPEPDYYAGLAELPHKNKLKNYSSILKKNIDDADKDIDDKVLDLNGWRKDEKP